MNFVYNNGSSARGSGRMIIKCWTKTALCEVIMGKTGLCEGRHVQAACPIASNKLICILCILYYITCKIRSAWSI